MLSQPVFAIVGGIAGGPWQPIADFCDGAELPCLFPETALPAPASPDTYTIYFSGGIMAEAEALAAHLGKQPRLLQVYADSPVALAAAEAFRAAQPAVVSLPLPADPSTDWWQSVLTRNSPRALIVWAAESALRSLDCAALRTSIYLSATLAGDPAGCRSAWLVSSRASAPSPSPVRTRMRNWQISRGVPPGNESIQLDAQFTLDLLDDCLRRMAGRFSRDYLLETVERQTESAPNPGVYPDLALGPGQRTASKGAWLLPPNRPRTSPRP